MRKKPIRNRGIQQRALQDRIRLLDIVEMNESKVMDIWLIPDRVSDINLRSSGVSSRCWKLVVIDVVLVSTGSMLKMKFKARYPKAA